MKQKTKKIITILITVLILITLYTLYTNAAIDWTIPMSTLDEIKSGGAR